MFTGMSRIDGAVINGAVHLAQSIDDILTTRPGERVYREEYGSALPEMVDRPINEGFLVEATLAIAESLDKLVMGQDIEPRFQLRRVQVLEHGAGWVVLSIEGEIDLDAVPSTVGLAETAISYNYGYVGGASATSAATPTSTDTAGRLVMVRNEMPVALGSQTYETQFAALSGSVNIRVNGVQQAAREIALAGRHVTLSWEPDPEDQIEVDYYTLQPATMPEQAEDGRFWLAIEGIRLGRA